MWRRGNRVSDTLLNLSESVRCTESDCVSDVVHKLLPLGPVSPVVSKNVLGHRMALPPCEPGSYHVFRGLFQQNFRLDVLPRPIGPNKLGNNRGRHPGDVDMKVLVFPLVVVLVLVDWVSSSLLFFAVLPSVVFRFVFLAAGAFIHQAEKSFFGFKGAIQK